ncbi:MAG: zf-HC2 domain-containing protein [Candidatus Poribacteria bacterium]|nr:zf-HC2 domain-containing protein [Candidatus Poribacteria bacterium]
MRRYSTEQAIRCEEVHSILEEYLAGELDTGIQGAVETHLTACHHCQNEMDFARGIGDMLRELPKPQPPPEVFDRVATYVRSHPKHKPAGWFDWLKRTFGALHLRPLGVGAASVCLICAILFGAYRQHQQSIQIEKASRDLSYALSLVDYAVQKIEFAIDERFPADRIKEAPRRALMLSLDAINTTTSNHLSRAIHNSFAMVSKFQ